jgi:flagellar hook-length control protein FliK
MRLQPPASQPRTGQSNFREAFRADEGRRRESDAGRESTSSSSVRDSRRNGRLSESSAVERTGARSRDEAYAETSDDRLTSEREDLVREDLVTEDLVTGSANDYAPADQSAGAGDRGEAVASNATSEALDTESTGQVGGEQDAIIGTATEGDLSSQAASSASVSSDAVGRANQGGIASVGLQNPSTFVLDSTTVAAFAGQIDDSLSVAAQGTSAPIDADNVNASLDDPSYNLTQQIGNPGDGIDSTGMTAQELASRTAAAKGEVDARADEARARGDAAQRVTGSAMESSATIASGQGDSGGDFSQNDERNAQDQPRTPRPVRVDRANDPNVASRAEQTLRALRGGEEMATIADSDGVPSSTGTASAQNSASGSAVSARLAQVERGLARDRVAQSLEQGILEISAGTPGSSAASSANGAAAPNTSQLQGFGSTQASLATAPFSGMLSDPASDLAASTLDARQTARLAAKGVDILANHRGGAITMRLEPPALGQLRIELRITQGAVVADFTAATSEARVLLEANLGMLRERLESQGLTVERMSVHGGNRGTETAPATPSQSGDPRQDTNGNASDGRDRGDRSGDRQDAAGGESRGRNDTDEQGRSRQGRDGRSESELRQRTFGGILNAQRTEDSTQELRTAV